MALEEQSRKKDSIFRRVSLCSCCLSAKGTYAATERILVKYRIMDLYSKLSSKAKSG